VIMCTNGPTVSGQRLPPQLCTELGMMARPSLMNGLQCYVMEVSWRPGVNYGEKHPSDIR
jgi:hypothetical protein